MSRRSTLHLVGSRPSYSSAEECPAGPRNCAAEARSTATVASSKLASAAWEPSGDKAQAVPKLSSAADAGWPTTARFSRYCGEFHPSVYTACAIERPMPTVHGTTLVALTTLAAIAAAAVTIVAL
jgi:hypothetical protein